jgi:UDP-N-acetylmuramoyl-L-alanyl-D-glutamate--2,6-diaminopimelate ligase
MEAVPGRLEFIDEGQPFGVLVDYAPEPESFRRLYEVLEMLDRKRIIHVFGSCGGGRDRDRRPVLGSIAGKRADIVIVTNEDPYDDDPMEIINEVAEGAREAGKTEGEDLFLILDRTEAIDKAVSSAREGDLVVLTGKGAEQAIVCAGGRKDPWDERTKVREAIRKTMKQDS